MASPARKPPAGTDHPDEALDILRRLEPVLARVATKDDLARVNERLDKVDDRLDKVDGRLDKVDGRLDKIEGRMDKVEGRMGKLETDFARMDGRLIELSARVPTIWTFATMVISLFGASFVLIRYASGH